MLSMYFAWFVTQATVTRMSMEYAKLRPHQSQMRLGTELFFNTVEREYTSEMCCKTLGSHTPQDTDRQELPPVISVSVLV